MNQFAIERVTVGTDIRIAQLIAAVLQHVAQLCKTVILQSFLIHGRTGHGDDAGCVTIERRETLRQLGRRALQPTREMSAGGSGGADLVRRLRHFASNRHELLEAEARI